MGSRCLGHLGGISKPLGVLVVIYSQAPGKYGAWLSMDSRTIKKAGRSLLAVCSGEVEQSFCGVL